MSRRNWAFDITLALAVAVLGQLEAWWGIGSTHRQGPLWVQSLLYAVTAVLLVFRRVHPLGCLAAIVVASVVEFVAVGSSEGFGVSLAPLIATYTVGSRLEGRRSWVGLVLSVAMGVAWAAFDPMNVDVVQRLGSLVWVTVHHRVAAGHGGPGQPDQCRGAAHQPRAAGIPGGGRGTDADSPGVA